MDGLLRLGRSFFAISIGIFGIQHFIYAHSTRGLVDVPPYTAKEPLSAYLIGVGFVVASLSLASRKKAGLSARLLGAALFLDFLIFHSPRILANLQSGNIRTRGFETLAMAGTAFVLAAAFPVQGSDRQGRPFDVQTTARAGRFLLAASLAIFGIQHFMYLKLIASLIPQWIPGRVLLAYFTGAAFLAAALSIASGKVTRWAGILLAAMFLLWVLVLHAPRVAHALHDGNEWASMIVALGMSGSGLIVAEVFP